MFKVDTPVSTNSGIQMEYLPDHFCREIYTFSKPPICKPLILYKRFFFLTALPSLTSDVARFDL